MQDHNQIDDRTTTMTLVKLVVGGLAMTVALIVLASFLAH